MLATPRQPSIAMDNLYSNPMRAKSAPVIKDAKPAMRTGRINRCQQHIRLRKAGCLLDGYNAFASALGRQIIPPETCVVCSDHPLVRELLAAANGTFTPSSPPTTPPYRTTPLGSLEPLRAGFLARQTPLPSLLREYSLLAFAQDDARANAAVWAAASVQVSSTKSNHPLSPTHCSDKAEAAMREMIAAEWPQLYHLVAQLILLLQSRHVGTSTRTVLLDCQALSFCTTVGLHLGAHPNWMTDKPQGLTADPERMHKRLFWLTYSWHCQIAISGAPCSPLSLVPSDINLPLPGPERHMPGDPNGYFNLSTHDPLSLYSKASLLLGQVHEYRRTLSPLQQYGPDFASLHHRISSFSHAVQVLEGVGFSLQSTTALLFSDAALISLYECTPVVGENLTRVWEVVSRMYLKATMLRPLLESGTILHCDVDPFIMWCWALAANMAADMDDFLVLASVSQPSTGNMWQSMRTFLADSIAILGQEYPVAIRIANEVRKSRPSLLHHRWAGDQPVTFAGWRARVRGWERIPV